MTNDKEASRLFELIASAIPYSYAKWRLGEVESLRDHLSESQAFRHPLEAAIRQHFHALSTPTRSRLIKDLINHARRLRAENGLPLPSSLVRDIAAAADAAFQNLHGLEELGEPDLDDSLGRLTLRQAVVTALAIQRCQERVKSPFVEVAEDLGLSKAAVSKILSSAEANLRVQVFELDSTGSRRSGTLTVEGDRLYGPLSRIAAATTDLTFALNPPLWLSLVPCAD